MQREKELKAQRDQDERLLEARKLAGMGFSVAEIEEELKRIKMVRLMLFESLRKVPCRRPWVCWADWTPGQGLGFGQPLHACKHCISREDEG